MIKIAVVVKPNSKHREMVLPQDDGSFVIVTKAAAVDGKANRAVVRLLAKHFGVRQRLVRIVSGHTAKLKIVEIDIDLEEERRKREIADQVVIMNEVIFRN